MSSGSAGCSSTRVCWESCGPHEESEMKITHVDTWKVVVPIKPDGAYSQE